MLNRSSKSIQRSGHLCLWQCFISLYLSVDQNDVYIDIHPSLFGDNLALLPHKKNWNGKLRFTQVLQRAKSMSSSYISSDTDPVIAKWIYTFSKILLTRMLNVLKKFFKSQRLNYVSNFSSPKTTTQR